MRKIIRVDSAEPDSYQSSDLAEMPPSSPLGVPPLLPQPAKVLLISRDDTDTSKMLRHAAARPAIIAVSSTAAAAANAAQSLRRPVVDYRAQRSWPKQICRFVPSYSVNDKKCNQFVKNIADRRSIRIFLSNPFDGCEKEREYFMKNAVPALNVLP